jgi:trimeric autotransporter adhesin
MGSENTATGMFALAVNSIGNSNTGIGVRALEGNVNGNDNTAVGVSALAQNGAASGNTAMGRYALYNNSNSSNTAIGFQSAMPNTAGFQNTSLGANSMVNNTTGAYNTAIGYNTGPNGGNLLNSTTLGIDARGTANDQVRIGNIFVGSIGGYQNWTNISDLRFKENIKDNVPGLGFITLLRPVTYTINRQKILDYLGQDASYTGAINSIVTTGFIAQEVEATAKKLGFDFSGVDAPKNDKDFYGLRYAEFVVPLVKAVQEQQKMIDNQAKEIAELKIQMAKLINSKPH